MHVGYPDVSIRVHQINLAQAVTLVRGRDEHLKSEPLRGGLGPVGISDPVLQRSLYERVYHHFLVRGSTLGEAVRRAKSEVLAANPAARPVVEGWSLIGDPALRWSHRPEPSTEEPPPDAPGEPGRR